MPLTVVLAQINLKVGDLTGNAQRITAAAVEARERLGADAILFPELALTGYPPEDLLLRSDFLDQCEATLAELQATLHGIHLILGYPRRRDGVLLNAAGVFYNGERVAEYYKALLPNYSVFDEKRYFEPGGTPCVVTIKGVAVALTICEDIWFREPALRAAAAGAELLLNLNASPFHTGKSPEREELLRKRALESGLDIAYVNLVGGQDELVFDGGSLVMGRDGRLCQRGPAFAEALIPVQFGPQGPLPGAVAAHCEEVEAVYRALLLGVRDYARKNGFQGAVLGLSGGIDSAVTLALAVAALGAEQVEVVLMPSRHTAEMSNQDAVAQAEALGVRHTTLPIEPAFATLLQMLQPLFAGLPPDVTEENLQARCRGILLMAISNKQGRILLTTGNKSEMAVGYATLYGDMAGGFAPLKDVPKLLVYRLAAYMNREREIIPQRVIERPPSAELAPDQRDSDSLPPYSLLDPILERYIEQDQGVAEIIAAGFDPATVARIIALVDRNEYKRRQAPPGVKITRRAFGRDRRYPLTNGFSATL